MTIWLINPYGPIPSESWRYYSFVMMADALTSAGHDVVWWTSNYSHHFKRFRSKGWHDIDVNERFKIRLVPTTGYKRNIGFGRILRDALFAYRCYARGKSLPAPDCIIYSESPLTFGFAGQKLARFHRCPVIFHQMDLWPELFEQVFPKFTRPLIKAFLYPIYRNRRNIYSQLDAVIALAKPYLQVPLNEAPILRTRPHLVVYNGIDVKHFRELMVKKGSLNVDLPPKQPGEVWAVFAGSLGPSYDIPTLISVSKLLQTSGLNLKIVIAGDGPLRTDVEKHAATKDSRMLYLAELVPDKLASLYHVCDIALCAYSQRSNVEMPDKIYDYTAAGLPVINSLNGEVGEMIRERKIGLQYRAGDAHDLLSALKRLANDPALRQEMAKNSFSAGAEYDKNVQYGKLVELTEKLSC